MIRLILWAFLSMVLWAGLALTPALAFAEADRGLPLIGGFLLATVLLYVIDSRVVRVGGFRQWRPPRVWMALAAFVAGLGVNILAREIGNITLSLRDTIPEPPEPIPFSTAVQAGLHAVHALCFIVVLNDIVHRTFRVVHKPLAAWLFTLAVGVFFGGLAPSLIQWAVILTLPTWLYRHSQSVGLAVAAMLPYALVGAAVTLGFGPGIQGFDVVDPEGVLWQPIWFDLLGAALLAGGVFPFLQSFIPPAAPAEE